MPRRSAASLNVVMPGDVPREPAPRHFQKDEKAEWKRVVQNLPRDWIPPAAYPLLEIYCTSIVNMRATRAVMVAAPEGSPRYEEAARLYRREAAQVVKLGKMLRLGPRFDRTKLRSVPSLRPWDLGSGAAAAPEPFKGFNWTPPDDDSAA